MELSKDIEDLRNLLLLAQQENSKRILNTEIVRLQSLCAKKPDTVPKPDHRPQEKRLTEYAWDQSDKFVKIYITLKNVQKIAVDNVNCEYQERSLTLRVKELENVNYIFSINHLLEPLQCDSCKFKIKTDMVLVMLAKKASVKWSHLTLPEKKEKDAHSSKYTDAVDEDADPSAGIMNLMKKMYDEGDDEMKRTIQKAWVESRDKQKAGGL